jgi:hypothetical protein
VQGFNDGGFVQIHLSKEDFSLILEKRDKRERGEKKIHGRLSIMTKKVE